MIFMDPPEHDRLRTARQPRVHASAASATSKRPSRRSSTATSTQFVGADQFDYVEQFGALVPPMVIGEMLGVPASDRDQLRHWFDDLLHRDDGRDRTERTRDDGRSRDVRIRHRDDRRTTPRAARRPDLGPARSRDRRERRDAPARRARGRFLRHLARRRRRGNGGAAAQLGRGRLGPQSRSARRARQKIPI